MREIKRQSILSEENEPVGVKPDIGRWKESDSAMEDHGLAHFILNSEDNDGEDPLLRNEAIRYYQRLNGIEDTR